MLVRDGGRNNSRDECLSSTRHGSRCAAQTILAGCGVLVGGVVSVGEGKGSASSEAPVDEYCDVNLTG